MSTTKACQVGIVQRACSATITDNITQNSLGIEQAAQQGAELVVLQELHNSLYFCQHQDPSYFDWAESIPGPSCTHYAAIAARLDITLVTSLFEKRAAGVYHNTAVVFDGQAGLVGKYRKMHIPDDPGFQEKFYFTPGDLGFVPIPTRHGRIGVLVCWDQWYPEAARLMALAGAEMLIYPTAIGWDPHDDAAEKQRQYDAWLTIQRSHAIANHLPVICCNRTGFEPHPTQPDTGIEFWGGSFITGPQGEIIRQAENAACVLTAKVPLNKTEPLRRIWPYFRDRRIDAYAGLLHRYLDDTQ